MLGYLDYRLFGDGMFTVRAVSPPGMEVHRLGALKGDQPFLKDAPPVPSPLADTIRGADRDRENPFRDRV